MKTKTNAPRNIEDIGNTPNVAYEKAKNEWAERMGEPIVEKNRWFVVSIVLALALAASLSALNLLMPLKTAVPWLVRVDRQTGEVIGVTQVKDLKVGDAEKKYFISRWIKNIVDLEQGTTEPNLRQAFLFVRGKAVEEYKDFMTKTRPLPRLQEQKTLTRKTDIVSFNFQADNSASIRFETEERVDNTKPVIKRYAAYVTFEIVPPTTDREIINNPLGLFITHFTIAEEIK